jgi:hypothetical protein
MSKNGAEEEKIEIGEFRRGFALLLRHYLFVQCQRYLKDTCAETDRFLSLAQLLSALGRSCCGA